MDAQAFCNHRDAVRGFGIQQVGLCVCDQGLRVPNPKLLDPKPLHPKPHEPLILHLKLLRPSSTFENAHELRKGGYVGDYTGDCHSDN